MKDYNFKEYNRSRARSGEYSVSVNKTLTLGFNSGFYRSEKISTFKKVRLYFDKQNNAMGIEVTNEENLNNTFTIIHSKIGNTGTVSISGFMKLFGIDKKKYFGPKVPRKIDYKGKKIFVLDL